MFLIVFALMLSTTLLSSVLATGDVINAAVQSVAVYNLGNIDEVIEGGRSSLGLYQDRVYYTVLRHAKQDPDIAAVGAALREQNVLVADQTSRQVRSQVTALGVLPGSEQGFGGMGDGNNAKQHLYVASLGQHQVYLNRTLAQLVNAHAGDMLYLYSQRWHARRYSMQVAGIVENGGLVGDTPYILTRLTTFQDIEGYYDHDDINQVFISNRGGGLNDVGLSDRVSSTLHTLIPHNVHVIPVKQQGVQNSQKAEDIFSRIFALFALFALAIGLLLILLIFVLLAAERRGEMGMVRAIGVQRRHLVLMFLFEGTVYDLLASFVGLAFGVGIGVLLVLTLQPILVRFNFPLKLTFQPHSLLIAYCLGVIFTFCSVALSSWFVSRMTIVDALHDLPESRQAHRRMSLRSYIWDFTQFGVVPLLAGYLLLQVGLWWREITSFSLGLSLMIIGAGLLLKVILRKAWVARLSATVSGLMLVAFWALPFDILALLGLPRFHGGIEVFFVAGAMMIIGIVWVLITNADVIAGPLLSLCAALPSIYAMAKLASVYPLQRRFRTGLSMIMFGLVVFTMTVMVVITNALQSSYVDINTQTGGYDIQATTYFKSLPDLHSSLSSHGIHPQAFSAIGVRETTAVGVVQLSADAPRWSLYPAHIVSGGFLQGYGLHLKARAKGFNSDGSIWQALQSDPNYALIDSSAIPSNNGSVYDPAASEATATPPNFPPHFTFSLSKVQQGDKSFAAVPLWIAGVQGNKAVKLTIIGVVDNSDNAHFGLYIPRSSYSADSIGTLDVGTGNDLFTSHTQTYYFKVAPGQDKRVLALALGSAYLDYGLETTVLEDAIWQVRGPRILLSDVLLGMVAMTLLLGVAALAITGTRAVVERRQQIGMLRALGCRRRMVQGAFLLESVFVGTLGGVLGIVLGIVLTYNIFAANFFEQFQTGLTFSIPWQQLSIVLGFALLASLLGALLPAWQAGRVTPAEALRY